MRGVIDDPLYYLHNERLVEAQYAGRHVAVSDYPKIQAAKEPDTALHKTLLGLIFDRVNLDGYKLYFYSTGFTPRWWKGMPHVPSMFFFMRDRSPSDAKAKPIDYLSLGALRGCVITYYQRTRVWLEMKRAGYEVKEPYTPLQYSYF